MVDGGWKRENSGGGGGEEGKELLPRGKTMIAFRTDGRMRREPSVERLSQLLLPLLYERMW